MEHEITLHAIYADILGSIAGALTTIAFLPQVIKVVKTKSTHDLSLGMFTIFSIGVLFWLFYGIVLEAVPIVIANSLTLTLSMIILWYKLRYG